jgi:hypothetical protein
MLPHSQSPRSFSFTAKEQNSGTAPEQRGVTGWTGGTREQKKETGDPVEAAREAADQPWMAEGVDLKGTPRQFPPKKTVE